MRHPGDYFSSLGVEMEMPTAALETGHSHSVGLFFQNLQALWARRNTTTRIVQSQGRDCGLHSPHGLHAIDNGYNNLESSLGPVPGTPASLDILAGQINQELRDVARVLALEQAMVVNFSEHPFVIVDEKFYYNVRAPRSIYDYQIDHRGWNHMSGLDAKAHNSPSTGMPVELAIAGLNCLLGLAPAFIALYANSPFEAGRVTGLKENRLSIWPRQMDCSLMPGDHKLHMPPDRPFRNLADYLFWMFGPGTNMWFASIGNEGKNPEDIYLASDSFCLLDFLRAKSVLAYPADGGPGKAVVPKIDHLVYHQFTQYSDCRVRYGLIGGHGPDLGDFMDVMDNHPDKLEGLLAPYLSYCYLEGRAAGANFPDRELLGLNPEAIAASVAVSPSALQTGLLQNLDQARKLLSGYVWSDLLGLRQETIRYALDAEFKGIKAKDLCARVLEVAGEGLSSGQAWMLAYPKWVLETGKTGADRAVASLERMPGRPEEGLWRLIRERRMIPPGPETRSE